MDPLHRTPIGGPRPSRPGTGAPSRRQPRRLTPAALVVVLVALGLAGACSSGGDVASPASSVPPQPDLRGAASEVAEPSQPVITAPDGWVAPDTRNVFLTPVTGKPRGRENHDVPVLPVEAPDGKAELSGVVVGPDGPVEGATVRLERFVGPDLGRLDVTTAKDGKWKATRILGGRYRVRAFAKPALAMTESRSIFLLEDAKAAVDMTLTPFEDDAITGALAVSDPKVGERAFFKVLVTRAAVDDDGIVRGTPVPYFPVGITPVGGVRVIGPTSDTTDGDGIVTFVVMCVEPGEHSVVVGNDTLSRAVGLPRCGDGAVPDENEPPEVRDVPVGTTLTTPTDGPLPAGTYVAVAGGPCGTSYELWVDNQWVRGTSLDAGLVFPGPVRRLAPTPDTKGCTFRRTA